MDFERDLKELLQKHKMNIYTHDSIMARHIIRSIDSFRESLREYNQINAEQHVKANNDNVRNESAMGSETP